MTARRVISFMTGASARTGINHGAFTPEQDNDKTNVEPVHFYYAFHTRSDKPGVKGIIEMHRFNFCLVVVLSLSCSGVKAPNETRSFFTVKDCAS